MTFARLSLSLLLVFCGPLIFAHPATALERTPSNAPHRGIVSFEMYQVFPESRQGNSVYYDNRLVLTLPNQTIRNVVPLPKEGRFAYLVEDEEGKIQFGIYVEHQDPPARITQVTDGFYFAVVVMDGVVYRKLFRVVENQRLVDLLPQSKTADGPVAGTAGVVFYHVATVSEREGETGEAVKEFGLRLHLALYDDERLRDLEFPVFNTLPRLILQWSEPNQITYTLADGRQEVVSVSQFQ